MQGAVARHLGVGNGSPVLVTEVSPEKEESLKKLHRLCDWVVTLDRNAGIEYFDSPQDNRAIYDAYVIGCVPEREDFGCLQLITSTTNLGGSARPARRRAGPDGAQSELPEQGTIAGRRSTGASSVPVDDVQVSCRRCGPATASKARGRVPT